jgi:hypothetical protein
VATRTIHEGVGGLLRLIGLDPGLVFRAGAVALLLLPQMALALLGLWLGRTYTIEVNVVVERRRRSEPEPGSVTDQPVIPEGLGSKDGSAIPPPLVS